MKKTFIIFFITLLFLSCSNKDSVEIICEFFDNATEQIEQATTLKDIENINDQLIKNIAVYTLSLSKEEYEIWADDPQSLDIINKTKEKYNAQKEKRELFLKGE